MPLTGSAARSLRALAHPLVPVVHVGKEGVTKALIGAVSRALDDHELIKVKVMVDGPVERRIAAAKMAAQTASEIVQVIGLVVVLYRPRAKDPKIPIPAGYTAPAPASAARDEDE